MGRDRRRHRPRSAAAPACSTTATRDDNILDLVELPPLLNTYTTNYTTIPELLASPLTATPTAVRFIDEFIPPVVYNWSAGVQRDIGWNFVGDVAYVGNAARNQRVDNGAINGRPYGYAYQPSSLDSDQRHRRHRAAAARRPAPSVPRLRPASPSGPTTATPTTTRCSSR